MSAGIGVNVHYIPVHLHPFCRERFGTGPGLCPKAEAAYEHIMSLPIFPAMADKDVDRVDDDDVVVRISSSRSSLTWSSSLKSIHKKPARFKIQGWRFARPSPFLALPGLAGDFPLRNGQMPDARHDTHRR